MEDNFFEILHEMAKKAIEKDRKLTLEDRVKLFLDYLDYMYNLYSDNCPLNDLDIKREDISICSEDICDRYGSKNCWLYWLLKGDRDER